MGPPLTRGVLVRRPVASWLSLAVLASLLVVLPARPSTAANTASVAGTVFTDTNGNGTQDTGELGRAAVAMTLLSGTTTVATTTTSSTGTYSFARLAAGTYSVRATAPSGYYASSTNPLSVTLSNGQAATGKNFGMGPANASIGDTVFTDANGNGTQDSTRHPLDGSIVLTI